MAKVGLAGGIKCFFVWLQCKLMVFLNKEWPVCAIINNVRLSVSKTTLLLSYIFIKKSAQLSTNVDKLSGKFSSKTNLFC